MSANLVSSPLRVLGAVARLSVGMTVVQGLGAVSQVFFALWLSPTDFGNWAIASSSLMLFSGLLNFGEVNGYLASPARRYRDTRRAVWKLNSVLAAAAVAVATGFLLAGNGQVALLVALLAVNLPLLGQANLLYAAHIRRRATNRLLFSMLIASLSRVVIGLAVAGIFKSPVAFAVSMLVYSVAMIAILKGVDRGGADATPDRGPSVRDRIAWTVQSLSQTVPTQVDFLVVALVASPGLLGIYYLSYQATVAVSALVVGPLSKSVLAELSRMPPELRQVFASNIMGLLVSALGMGACLLIALLHVLSGYVPEPWTAAAPTIAILLTSLPSRFQTPVADSLQMATARWWFSTRLNGIDALGTAAVALTALTGSLTVLALSMAAWKICYAAVRVWLSLSTIRSFTRARMTLWPVGLGSLLMTGVSLGEGWLWAAVSVGFVSCLAQLMFRSRRELKAGRQDVGSHQPKGSHEDD